MPPKSIKVHIIKQKRKYFMTKIYIPLNSTNYNLVVSYLKFIYSEKATKFCEISTLLSTTVHTVKSKVDILQNFVAFSEYINFNFRVSSSAEAKVLIFE